MKQCPHPNSASRAPWVGIDWGTSNIRAYRMAADNSLIDSCSKKIHISDCAQAGFESILNELLAPWQLPAHTPTLMCGMAGSKMGWVEAPYVNCPATVDALLQQSVAVPHHPHISIIPGLSYVDEDGGFDVMRGEEVQLLGLFDSKHFSSGTICAPGTHTKWVYAKDKIIERFRTTMTGELFSVLSEHSILRQSLDAETESAEAGAGFERGLETVSSSDHLLADLFKVRTDALFGVAPEQSGADYLSGLLIGHDVKQSVSQQQAGNAVIPIIGPPAMSARYQRALRHFGFQSEILDANHITLAGLISAREQQVAGVKDQ